MLDYVWEKYYKAAQSLASNDDTLRDRVANSYVSNAVHAYPPSGKIPEELAERIHVLHRKLTGAPDPSNIGTIRASVDLMDEEELRDVAQEIVDIAFEATRALAEQRSR